MPRKPADPEGLVSVSREVLKRLWRRTGKGVPLWVLFGEGARVRLPRRELVELRNLASEVRT